MKNTLLLIIALNTVACSMAGFRPPGMGAYWKSPKHNLALTEYVDWKFKEMRECGIEPGDGYHKNIKEGLCMEAKGWHWTDGSICNRINFVDNPSCFQWRAEHGLPYPKPEEIREGW